MKDLGTKTSNISTPVLLQLLSILLVIYILHIKEQRFTIMSTSSKQANQATRSANRCPVFDLPQNLTEMNLPTYRFVVKHYRHLLVEHSYKMNSQEQPCVTEVATIIAKELEAIWQKASIPTVSRTKIVQLVKNYLDNHRNLLKPFKTRQITSNAKQGLQNFRIKQRVY